MIKLKLPVAALLALCSFLSKAQNTVKFYQALGEDSVAMFFNNNNKYVDKKCAMYVRYTRIDKEGDLNGRFIDYQLNPFLIRATGAYINGEKNGSFELFYHNGKTRAKGDYINDKPHGKWEFFYENGLPERQILASERDTLLIRLVNTNGDLLVENGNGQFEGWVSGNFPDKNEVLAKGEIANGKPVGKWTSLSNGKPFCDEEFDDNGKFIKGSFPGVKSKDREYNNRSFLVNQMPADYLTEIETVAIENCSESAGNEHIKLDFNYNNFTDALRQQLNKRFMDIDGLEEINYMTVEFLVRENRKLDDFKLTTSWGTDLYGTVVAAIRRNAKFSGGTGKMYLHLRFVSSVNYDAWTFKFSEQPEIKF